MGLPRKKAVAAESRLLGQIPGEEHEVVSLSSVGQGVIITFPFKIL
jgi:hypothetical protein